jgi:hypothetical protein
LPAGTAELLDDMRSDETGRAGDERRRHSR